MPSSEKPEKDTQSVPVPVTDLAEAKSPGQPIGQASELDSAAQALIGHHLRTLYGEIVREPVPDQFLKLLQDLERRERE